MAEAGNTFTSESGSAIKPQYAQRSMKCYAVTESELRYIGLANNAATVCFGIGSAFLALWLDIFREIQFSSEIPEAAQAASQVIQPFLLILWIVFWGVAIMLYFWRRNMILLIKQESK